MTGAELIPWLLDGDPAVRWQTLRDLGDHPMQTYESERKRVATTGWGRELLGRQDPEGTWAGAVYSPKWTSTTYTLLLLYRFGLPQDNAAAHRGVEVLWKRARFFDGGLTAAKTIDVPEGCITAMYVALAKYFGYRDDRVDGAVEWLLRSQLQDGGWNCETARSGAHHGSFHTSISTLEALAKVQARDGEESRVTDAMAEGHEFFLQHHLFRSHRTGEVADPAFLKLSFPPRWHYDVLRGLDHFQAVDARWDDRFSDALEVLAAKRRADETWPVQHKHAGRTWFTMEHTGGPSRWNTLRALRVLRWANA